MFSGVCDICRHSFLPRFIRSNSVVVDLGAFHGEFSLGIIQRFQCKVIAVEPLQKLFTHIERHPLLDLRLLAVGGKNETIEINIFPERCASVYEQISASEQAQQQSTEMITLEELSRRVPFDHIDLIKINIEGAEIDLFNGCSDELLQATMQITMSFHDFIYPEQGPAIAKIKERLRQIGFWEVRFTLDNTDILYINRRIGVGPVEVAYLRSVVKYGRGIGRLISRQFAR